MNEEEDMMMTFEVGYAVALKLSEEIGGNNCFVGEVQAVDEHGIRITLIDWLLGRFCGNDFYAPWRTIDAAMIATPEHDLGVFIDYAMKWQAQLDTAHVEALK